MKIRDDIEEALGVKLNLCLADWHKDGHERKGLTINSEEDIDISSSVIWMTVGAPRDLLLKHYSFEQSNTPSNIEKPKFSVYKFNFPSGSLIQMKPPTTFFWSPELLKSDDTEKGLYFLLRFMMTVEENSCDNEFNYFCSDNSTSKSKSDNLSHCSTISPVTEKVKRLKSQSDLVTDDGSSVLYTPRQCASVRSSEIIKREMTLDLSLSYPILAQSSATSIRPMRQAELGNLIKEQLLDISQLCANRLTESSTQTGDSDQSYRIVTQSSATSIRSSCQAEPTSIQSSSQAEHGISIKEKLLDLSQLCANGLTESSTQTGDSVNSMP